MSERDASPSPGIVIASGKEPADAFGVTDMLGLAATPTFAIMAAATGILDGGSVSMLCMGDHDWALGGMTPMYALMSLFHLPPWLKLVSGRQRVRHPVADRQTHRLSLADSP